MQRTTNTIAGVLIASLVAPASACAVPLTETPLYMVHLGASLLGLVVAIVLLIEALAVRRVALGGAVAEKMSYVVLAIVCLAASALARWTGNFVSGFTLSQTELASEFLVIVAMALLTAYFYSVRVAMQSYMKVMTDTVRPPKAETPAGLADASDEAKAAHVQANDEVATRA